MKKFSEGRITISRPRGSGADYISIRITDDSSGCQLIEANISLAEFTEALTGLAEVHCQHDATSASMTLLAARVGKRLRTETVLVDFDTYGPNKGNVAATVAKIIEETGCARVRESDLTNRHCQTERGKQNVVIWFYDEIQEPKP